MTKYRISLNDIEQQGGIAKLERDGFKREEIMKTMYKKTEGASTSERQEIVSKLYDRRERC